MGSHARGHPTTCGDAYQTDLSDSVAAGPTQPSADVSGPLYIRFMATFITGTHYCPECHEAHSGSRAFAEHRPDGHRVDWCAFQCPNGHVWARPGMQAVK